MKTKLISITIILMFSLPLAICQSTDKGKTSFALLGGINLQNLNGKDISGDKLTNDMLIGYHFGLNIQVPVAPQFYFQPGLLFSTKGAKNSEGILSTTYKISYIELPLNLVYKGSLGKGKILIGFGPYVGYGIGGKVITEGGTASLETKVAFKNIVELTDPLLTTYYKALDAGGNIFAGYEMAGGLFLQLDTQLGMIKINPENKWISNDKSSIKNTGFGLSLGYRF